MTCPTEDIRLAFLHNVLAEVVEPCEVSGLKRHMEACTNCQAWFARERAFDVSLSEVLREEQVEVADLVSAVQASVAERKRQWAALSLVTVALFVGSGAGLFAVAGWFFLHFGFSEVLVGAVHLVQIGYGMLELSMLWLGALLPKVLPYTQLLLMLLFVCSLPWLVRLARICNVASHFQKGVVR